MISYTKKLEEWKTAREALGARASRISALRLLMFGGALGSIGVVVFAGVSPTIGYTVLVGCIVGFVALVFAHAAVFERRTRAEAAVAYYEQGQLRLDDRWRELPARGNVDKLAEHPYADDLDIAGPGSLLQLTDVTSTRFGERHLAALLLEPVDDPCSIGKDRQALVRELVPLADFREQLAVVGSVASVDRADPEPFIAWVESGEGVTHAGAFRVIAWLLPLASLVLFVLGKFGVVPGGVALVPMGISYVLTFGLAGKWADTFRATDRERGLVNYAEVFSIIDSANLSSPLGAQAKKQIASSGRTASREMARLGRIVSFASARSNDAFRLFIGPVLMWDVHTALALDSFRSDLRGRVRGWFEALGEIEAFSSLATFAYERPDAAWPSLTAGAGFSADGLGHPLLPSKKRVGNDIELASPLVVTGSNMAGKSTLLRAIGINVVLAYAGAPVCATQMTVGSFAVVTSMRVRDSVGDGVSRFYAELQKLRVVLQTARRTDKTRALFLLDEILHGTNARERLIGARAFLKELVATGATGAVSTHDLELGNTADIRNVHFEEQVNGDVMSFDYRLREGVVQSSNALRLMRLVGIDVV